MELLLSKQQIAYIKSRTFIGPSKRDTLRSLLNRGIAEEKRERERERAAYDIAVAETKPQSSDIGDSIIIRRPMR